MPEESFEDFLNGVSLTHYGVPGMKWGVRKNRKGMVKARATMTRKERKDQEWLNPRLGIKDSYTKTYSKSYRRAQGKIRKAIRTINKSPKFKDQDFRKASPLRKEYYDTISKAISDQLNASAVKHGISPSGKLQMNFTVDVATSVQPTVNIGNKTTGAGRKDVKEIAKISRTTLHHADVKMEEVILEAVYDAMGYIEGFVELDPKSVSHADTNFDDFLIHYGILGMKWGVRKDRSTGKRRGKPIEGTDKARHKKNRKSGKGSKTGSNKIKTLSDQDLKDMIARVKLEGEYAKLTAPQKSAAKKFVADIVLDATKSAATNVLRQQLTTQGNRAAAKLIAKMTQQAAKTASQVAKV